VENISEKLATKLYGLSYAFTANKASNSKGMSEIMPWLGRPSLSLGKTLFSNCTQDQTETCRCSFKPIFKYP
jgi:hypothetical protein